MKPVNNEIGGDMWDVVDVESEVVEDVWTELYRELWLVLELGVYTNVCSEARYEVTLYETS